MKITPESRRKPKIDDEDKDVVLVLAPFNNLPKLLFENVKVGTSKLQHIIVRNPNDSRVEVCQFNFFGFIHEIYKTCERRFVYAYVYMLFIIPCPLFINLTCWALIMKPCFFMSTECVVWCNILICVEM